MLIIFGGLPGTGKTTIARELARQIGAMHLRVDSIEQAILNSGLASRPVNEAGYFAAYAVAEDNLRIGRIVVADSVNSLPVTRDAWVAVAKRSQASFVEIEVVCSDAVEHRRRVEQRVADVSGLKLPTWDEVMFREYHRWDRAHIVVDTARQSVEESVRMLRAALAEETA